MCSVPRTRTETKTNVIVDQNIRRLTPRETGRLQSIPEDKLEVLLSCGVSKSQLFKMFGNGWNVKVIAHMLKYLD
jgi:site-specific DNA-cytosine methylase